MTLPRVGFPVDRLTGAVVDIESLVLIMSFMRIIKSLDRRTFSSVPAWAVVACWACVTGRIPGKRVAVTAIAKNLA
jgi:hypothetical protein